MLLTKWQAPPRDLETTLTNTVSGKIHLSIFSQHTKAMEGFESLTPEIDFKQANF